MKLKLLFVTLFTCLGLVVFGQLPESTPQVTDTSYNALWQQAEKLLDKEFSQQGTEIITQIEALARRDKNYPQLIKVLLVQLSIEKSIKETNLWVQLQKLDAEANLLPAPHKNVLQSMIGSAWLEISTTRSYYYEGELEPDTTDPTTWPINELLKRAEGYFLASVANDGLLKETAIKNYSAVIDMPKNAERYQPMLYDVLMWRLYNFYKLAVSQQENSNNDTLIQPGRLLFADRDIFLAQTLQTNPADTYGVKALRVLQALISRYRNASIIDALVMADIERINFAVTNYNIENEDSLQLAWLEAQISRYSGHRIVPELYYRAAQMLSCEENSSVQQNCNNPKALRYCQTAFATFPDEPGTQWCKELAEQIEKPSLKITTEFTNLAKAPFKYLINYKNTHKIYVKYIAITDESLSNVINFNPYNSNDSNQRFRLKKLLEYPIKGEDEISLPDDTTLLNYSTEWYCKGLPEGHYIILFSADKNFTPDTTITGYTAFWSTKYALYSTKIDKNKHRFFIADMQTNAPLKGAKIVVSYDDYRVPAENGHKKIIAEKITDKNGSIEVEVDDNYWSVEVEVFKGDKKIITSNTGAYLTNNHYDGRDFAGLKTHFLTDRGIYRPGQTVYFKGYMLNPANKDSVLPAINLPTTVILEDANGEKVGEVKVITNKYGTFSGSFVIPYGRVTGYYTLRDNYGNIGISVEEYKRPKFKVDFDTLKTNPTFYDTITVTGRAVAYSGNVLDGASFEYVVVREINYQYFDYKYGGDDIDRYGDGQVLAQGTSVLDNEGKFTLKFAALPGKNQKQNYQYNVSVTVTDITGEVQTGYTTINVGKRNVYASISAANTVFTDEKIPVIISATNLNGNAVPLKGTFNIKELITAEKIQKALYWDKPDVVIMPQEIQAKYFSNQKYPNQTTESSIGKTVFTRNIDSISGEDMFSWGAANVPQGSYQLAFEYVDNLGEKQVETKNLTVCNAKGKKAFTGNELEIVIREAVFEPGQTAEVIISSRAPNTRVLYFMERNGQTTAPQQVKLNNSLYTLKIPVTEADRGGITITAFTVHNNRFYESRADIYVPFSNKNLKVEVTAYRDKMLPGGKEEWQLKITGPDAQKVSAEVVASMYDASLDKFASNTWYNFFNSYQKYHYSFVSPSQQSMGIESSLILTSLPYKRYYTIPLEYNLLRFFKWIDDPLMPYNYSVDMYGGLYNSGGGLGDLGMTGTGEGGGGFGGGIMGNATLKRGSYKSVEALDVVANFASVADYAAPAMMKENANTAATTQDADNLTKLPPVPFMKVRRNLDETVFFFPHLQTDDSGAVIVKFIAPEALTQWNFRAFAHTTDLKNGTVSLSAITQKPLMVQTNMPRFLREGDEIYINAKVVNLSEGDLSPNVVLEVYDAATGKNIKEFNNLNIVQVPQMTAGVSQSVKWKFTVPKGYGALKIIIKAYDGQFTDAEANTLPVLSDEILVTEALPITFSGNQPKTYELKKLTQSGQSTTLKNHKLTVEFTSNPAWYAIQALPYMMEYPHECAEQVFNRVYANTIAQYIANNNPAIRNVFDSWQTAEAKGEESSFISNLEKTPELKALLLTETPWVAEGKNETERKQRLGILFDKNMLNNQTQTAIEKLTQMQLSSGAFPWFSNMQPNLSITQYIVSGIGRLNHILQGSNDIDISNETGKALTYMHKQAQNGYTELKNTGRDTKANALSFSTVQYLYALSYFDEGIDTERNKYDSSIIFWQAQAAKYWKGRSRMEQAMIAITLYRAGNVATSKTIIEALRQNAVTNADNGMHWKEMTGGYGWTEAPIETQAIIIEAFSEIANDTNAVNQMRKWLLKQKQLNDWKTTRATADACYALLLNSDSWLQTEVNTTIALGNTIIDTKNDPEISTEAGTGYFKKSFNGEAITPEMGKMTVSPQNSQNMPMAWGGVYWQYFEKLDKVTRAQTPLSLIKQLFIEKNTDTGIVKIQLKPGDVLKTGDKIVVRIFLKANNDMEFVYLKDMRAAALEPVDFLSGYHWQNGVGYYQSIRDASMNFFFDRLPKGQWVFEYEVKVSQAGTFQNGIATVQSMYAPEYTSHSEGFEIEVKP